MFTMNSPISYTDASLPTLPMFLQPVKAGFPSPAEDFLDNKLDLNEFLIKHPAATFFLRVSTDSMKNAGIYMGDVLIVDRSLEPANNAIVVVAFDGELLIKRITFEKGGVKLLSENPHFATISITEDQQFQVWGVVTSVIHKII